jgi:hypothetical protein
MAEEEKKPETKDEKAEEAKTAKPADKKPPFKQPKPWEQFTQKNMKKTFGHQGARMTRRTGGKGG